MANDKGTEKSYTLELVKEMGHSPIMISVINTDEVFIFETKAQAQEAESDFSPEGIWVAEEDIPDLKIQGLGKIYDLRVKEEPAEPAISGSKAELLEGAVKDFAEYLSKGTFVFSGFRSAILEKNIQKLGGKVEERVTTRTTSLIVKDLSKSTGKKLTADKYGIEVITLSEFNSIMTNTVVKSMLGL